MGEFALVLWRVDRKESRRASQSPLVRLGGEYHQVHTCKLQLVHYLCGGLEEPGGVALDPKELGEGFLDHRLGAEDGYGCRALFHLSL
jgi:hypothetical protein